MLVLEATDKFKPILSPQIQTPRNYRENDSLEREKKSFFLEIKLYRKRKFLETEKVRERDREVRKEDLEMKQ